MRKFAKLLLTIWEPESEFLTLSDESKLLYIQFISAPELTSAGVAPHAPALYVGRQERMTARKFAISVRELEARRFVIVDRSHALVMVRSFIRHDNLLPNENMSIALAHSIKAVTSPLIRREIGAELARIYRDAPALKGWKCLRDVDPQMMDQVLENVKSPAKQTESDIEEQAEGPSEGRPGTPYPYGLGEGVPIGGY